jgi:hypothetical protein
VFDTGPAASYGSRVRAHWPAHPAERGVLALLVLILVGTAVVALAGERWWLSSAAALSVASLLVLRHARARFAAYVFLSVLAARAGLHGRWGLTALGVGGVLLLQTSAARRLWPRLGPPARMTRP